jgi:hypothetical protein
MNKRGTSLTQILIAILTVVILFVPISYYFSVSSSDIFFAPPVNTPPLIGSIEDEIFACEGSSLSYVFDVTDLNENSLRFDISPKYKDPFFIRKISGEDAITTQAEIFSGTLKKEHINQDYPQQIFVSDDQFIDTATTKITIIEINNPPVLDKLKTQTVSLNGLPTNYTKLIKATDEESKIYISNKLIFGLSFIEGDPIFQIDPITGLIEAQFGPTNIGVHNIEICVKDSGIKNVHDQISQCSQGGGEESDCKIFQLTITNSNRQPTIQSFRPSKETSINITGNQTLNFNISKFDADGTDPEVYWYVDNTLKQEDGFRFSHTFGCDVFGNHKIKAEITDGLLNDSLEWKINVKNVECPIKTEKSNCEEKWGCQDWNVCQNAIHSFENGILSISDNEKIQSECSKKDLANEFCGFQIRDCAELSSCNATVDQQPELRACYFILNPSCSDGVENCHDESCEKAVDCGGPCSNCLTCSDGIKNQGEEEVDCGGPCLKLCNIQPTLLEAILEQKVIKYTIFTILFVSLIIVVVQLMNILRSKNELRKIIKRLNKKGKSLKDEFK